MQEANPSAPGFSPRANWSPRPVLVGTPLPKASQWDRGRAEDALQEENTGQAAQGEPRRAEMRMSGDA